MKYLQPDQSVTVFDDVDRSVIEQSLCEDGVVLLRGFDAAVEDFERLSKRLCHQFHESSARLALKQGDGYTAEVFRDNFILFAHSEGFYRPFPEPPQVCFFYCVKAPVCHGGETTLLDGEKLLAHLPVKLRERFEVEPLIYESVWDEPRWQSEFQLDSVQALKSLLDGRADVAYQLDGSLLTIRYSGKAIQTDMQGRQAFANGLLAHLPELNHPRYRGMPVHTKESNKVLLGDSPLASEDVNLLVDLQDSLQLTHRWQDQDLLIVDNTRFMHGRLMTEQPAERILLSRFGRISP